MTDQTGCFKDSVSNQSGWKVETYSNVRFPLDLEQTRALESLLPLDELIKLEDIAHALSNICRFTGHCREFYSVAEHSVLVAQVLEQKGYPLNMVRSALLHDASEAYLGDLSRPLKVMLPEYQRLERHVQNAIYERYDAHPDHLTEKMIKMADNIMIKQEARCLMPSGGKDWDMDEIEDYRIPIISFSPDTAKCVFLEEAKRLMISD